MCKNNERRIEKQRKLNSMQVVGHMSHYKEKG